ncbi:unnamed protein product [Miscanthus lutarioriparius]|uniref:CCHC-type domain-containing protein n=1 Tax=Miscanthus lutarioriparius TaxID=422564 RepID=A0A811QJA1_9POAL|nr:unnamed protein product [Miscanthus lutarioriparius]
MAYMDYGDGDHHEEQFDGDGDPQRNNGLYHVISVLMSILLYSTFTLMAPSNSTPFALRSVLEKDKLNGTNYTDWIHNLRIVLRADKKEDVLDTPLPEEPADDAPATIKNAYKKACDANLENKPSFKKKGNSWKKKGKVLKSKPNPAPKVKAGPAPDKECFYCHELGHWKRNCKQYLASLKNGGSKSTSTSGHISENRMKRLHSDGLLTLFDFESYETCEACLLGKMTKTPFTGFVFTINGGAISWKSSKQETVTDSTAEAEYITASGATKEGVWMRRFLIELGVFLNASSPLNLHCDNNGAIAQAKEPRNHQKNKHVLRKFHLIREFIRRDEIKMCKIHTDLNVADPLTKALPQPKHEAHMRAMGIRYLLDRLYCKWETVGDMP